MKNHTPKGLIPRLSLASLTLGAAACGGDDKADNSPEGLAERYCRAIADCDPEFVGIAECVGEYATYFEAYSNDLREEYGLACANAFTDYIDCIVKAYDSTSECNWDDENPELTRDLERCFDTLDSVCEFDDYYEY